MKWYGTAVFEFYYEVWTLFDLVWVHRNELIVFDVVG